MLCNNNCKNLSTAKFVLILFGHIRKIKPDNFTDSILVYIDLQIILTITKHSSRQMSAEEEAELRVGWLSLLL